MARSKARVPGPTRQQPKRTPTIDAKRAFGSKSIIVNADIQTFLATCMSNWSNYSDEEKTSIVASLPPTRQPPNGMAGSRSTTETIGTSKEGNTFDGPPIDSTWLSNDEYVKRAVARFCRDTATGFYEKSWQDKAKRASQERTDGKFDEYWSSVVEQMFCPADDIQHKNDNSSDGEYKGGKPGDREQKRSKIDC